jgi:trehalose 6-phosphate synthase/phosphatase
MQNELIIVSNRLPISVRKTNSKLEFYPSVGGLATGLAGYTKDKKCKWIGWPGLPSDLLTDDEKTEITEKLLAHNCYPIFLSQEQLDGFYYGYSNCILWPLFHGMPITLNTINRQKEFWSAYKQVNKIFADFVLQLCDHKGNIWVNDYQLMLLPALLRQEHFENKIGFFLHIPFPETKDFLDLKNAIELLLGVLGAELIGLHTESYAYNLINSCQKLNIGLLTEDCIALDDRIIRITNFPMGIDYKKFARTAKRKSVKKEIARLSIKYADQKIVLTVDRLDPTKGLIERAIAFRDLLRNNSMLHGNTMMVMLVVPSRTQIEEYEMLRQQLEKLINEVNDEFRTQFWAPIEFIYSCLPLDKLVALYQHADIAFIAPLKDGMNLVSKEYIASKSDRDGVLILSKTAGSAEELHDALIVDPNQPIALVRALEKAITMSPLEIQRRLNNMQKHISTYTVQNWANNFINSLIKSPMLPKVSTKQLTPGWQTELISNYSTAIKRTILLDYDGTLTPFFDKPELAKPSIQLKEKVKKLTASKQNKIVIISGRDKASLGEWFNDIPVILVVEHGDFVRKARGKRWHTTNNFDTSWQPIILNLFNQYIAKVPGSFIEQKENSLVWHYRVAKQYYVKKYLISLIRLLRPLAKKLNLKIEQGNMVLEVRPYGVSKGTSALKYSQHADFVMAIGDDVSDEEMFSALPTTAWTIKVGIGQTSARYRVRDINEVHQLLSRLHDQSKNS